MRSENGGDKDELAARYAGCSLPALDSVEHDKGVLCLSTDF